MTRRSLDTSGDTVVYKLQKHTTGLQGDHDKNKNTAGLQGDYLRAAGYRSRHAGHVDKLLPPLLARESSSKLKMQTKHAGHVDKLLPPLLACESSSELNKTENLLYRSKSLLSLLGILPLN